MARKLLLTNTSKPEGYLASIGPGLLAGFMQRGVLLRPLGNTIYVMPPYCVTESDLELIYTAIDEVVGSAS